jgi:hypothetical protein
MVMSIQLIALFCSTSGQIAGLDGRSRNCGVISVCHCVVNAGALCQLTIGRMDWSGL